MSGLQSEHKWKQLAELASTKGQFSLAQECLHQAQDYGGLLLLATTSGSAEMVGKLAEGAEKDGKTNVAFLTYFMQGRLVFLKQFVLFLTFGVLLHLYFVLPELTNVWSCLLKLIDCQRLLSWQEHTCPAKSQGKGVSNWFSPCC